MIYVLIVPAPSTPEFDVALFDYNYDFHVDLVHVNADGIYILEQDTTWWVYPANDRFYDGCPDC